MKLKEKIHQRIKYHTGLYKSNLTKEISEIADDYAIEFADWLTETRLYNEEVYSMNNTKQLLEIFKKEKGI
jgi:hypothetical protein